MKVPNLKITYNPFTVMTQFELNGELITAGSLTEMSQNRRLQQWVDKIFPLISKDFNTREIKLTFEGTSLDAADVRDAVKLYARANINLDIVEEYITHDVSVDEKVSLLKKLFKRAQSGPFDEFRSEEMKRAFERALAPEFEVNVLATMSAGKSTVINAMIGKELMPSKNEACTATIAKIHDHDDMAHFEARRFGHEGQSLGKWKDANLGLIEEWNSDQSTSIIEIKGNIPTIDERAGVKLVLIDTPGPNNSRDEAHRKATIQAIKGKQPSMVLYVLNATQLSTDDDRNLLNLIKDVLAEGGREAQDRFIFIANKIDSFDPENGESVSNALINVKKYLKENGINNPLVVPASAELTKLLRMAEFEGSDALSRKQKGNLTTFIGLFTEEKEMNMLEHVRSDIDSSMYLSLNEKLETYKFQKNNEKAAEILSGIPIVEALLDNYILKHAIPARLKDAVDAFKSIAAKTNAIKAATDVIDRSQAEIEQITTQIEKFQSNKEQIQKAKSFREKVALEEYIPSKKTTNLRKEIDRKVNDLLDDFAKEFKGDVTPSEAKRLMTNAERKAMFLVSEIQEALDEDLQDELKSTLDRLRNEYQEHIADLLNNSFPDGRNMKLINEFQRASLEMPDLAEIIEVATYVKKEEIFLRTERHGFLWLKKRDVYQTNYEDRVDMSGPTKELEENLQFAKLENYRLFRESAEKNLEIAKKTLLKQMAEIDAKFNLTIDKMKEASKNKSRREKEIAENRIKIDWFNNFQKELDAILCIK